MPYRKNPEGAGREHERYYTYSLSGHDSHHAGKSAIIDP
jgi:hypothetical protein